MKYSLKIEYFGKIKDLNERTDLSLVVDSQEVEFIKEYLGGTDKRKKLRKILEDYSLFFVNVQDGDYTEIYASTHSVAWLEAHLDKIEVVWG